jgi:pimeloyl-ACP methyl ester carboxylesterase
MTKIAVPGCLLDYDVLDLTPAWMEAPETILFHHGIGATKGIWAEWLPSLIDRYRIIRFDMRGHGASSWPKTAETMGMDNLVDDVFAVLDAAGVGRAHLVGESIGGTVMLNAALRAPERAITLTVSNGAHVGAAITAVQDWQSIIETQGMAGWSAHMMRGRFFDGGIPEAVSAWYEAQQRAVSPQAVLAGLAALVGADLSARLDELRLPVLLMHPDSSPFIPVAVMADFKKRLRDGRLHVIGRAKHGMPVSHAAQCSSLLRDFLNR